MQQNIQIISDFNAEPLSRLMAVAPALASFHTVTTPFGQVHQSLSALPVHKPWAAVVWTHPERIFPHFARALDRQDVNHNDVLSEVDAFAALLLNASQTSTLFVGSWLLPTGFNGYGPLDWREGLGLCNLIALMNLRLAEKVATAGNIYILDCARWQQGLQASSPKMWYAAKVPYSAKVFERASADVAAVIDAIRGHSRRLIVLDLDNTLWGGVIGETGWQGIRLGGHDHIGEAFKDFQKELKSLSNCGIQLAIVSKNDEPVALEAIDHHPEMLLRRDDFAGWRINWQDKSANLAALVADIGLGLASVVFIDDNPAERARVAGSFPEVLVPNWPEDPTAYVAALRELNCFHTAAMSKEDRGRKAMYVAERARKQVLATADSPEDWLRRLSTRLTVSRINPANTVRVAQLFNKTNQLNLSTRRLSESEIIAWASDPTHSMLAISASDQFGDMGLIGIIGVEVQGEHATLTDFILSCRVMGRNVEDTMIHLASIEAIQLGARQMDIRYLPTARNRPTLDVFINAQIPQAFEHVFVLDLNKTFPKPESVAIACFEA